MAKIVIAGNWKQNGSFKSSVSLAKSILFAMNRDKVKHEVIIFPPAIFLLSIKKLINQKKLKLGSQNVSAYKNGAYTGEISSTMLKESGINYCLVGHSERRHILHEDEATLSNKVTRLYEADIKIIYCIGETLKDYKDKKTKSVLKSQIQKLFKGNGADLKKTPNKLIIAYEPVWAIGTGLVPTSSELNSVFTFIRNTINRIDKKYSTIKILYGGSVTPDNAGSLMETNHIDGLLVGGASLISKKFIDICSTI